MEKYVNGDRIPKAPLEIEVPVSAMYAGEEKKDKKVNFYRREDDNEEEEQEVDDELIDRYRWEYKYDMVECEMRMEEVEAGVTTVNDYMNRVRANALNELVKAQKENLEAYETNKLAYKINPSEINSHKLEELRKQLFADKFCFLLEIKKLDNRENKCIYQLYTIITDFYLNQADLNLLKYDRIIK